MSLSYLVRTRHTIDDFYGQEEFNELGRYPTPEDAIAAARKHPETIDPGTLAWYQKMEWRIEIIIEGWAS